MDRNKSNFKSDFASQDAKAIKEEKKNIKKAKKKDGKPGFFKRMGQKLKDVFSELKKVSWPSFSKVVKQTGVVLMVVVIFLVVIAAFDFGLSELLKLVS